MPIRTHHHHRPRRTLGVAIVAVLVLAVLVAACGPVTSEPEASPPSSVPADGPGTGSAPVLLVGISVHVEGWMGEATDPARFARHRDAIVALARTAADAGAVLTFELSPSFVDGALAFDPGVVDELQGLGHAIALHADLGGQGTPSEAELETALRSMRLDLASLGVDATHVSGICSRGPWVEAALAAGFRSTSGAVAYCATSMDPALLTADQTWVLACASPIACHGAPPADAWHQWNPFMSDSSRDWMLADDPSGLVIVVGASGGGIPCPDGYAHDDRAGADPCDPDDADIPALAGVLDEALAARVPGETHALTFSWSIGTIPTESYARAVFAVFADAVAAGSVRWASLPAIAATAP